MKYVVKMKRDNVSKLLTKTQVLFIDKLSFFLNQINPITNTKDYNVFIRELVLFAKKQYRIRILTPLFDQTIKLIENKLSKTEKTIWGGIFFKENPKRDAITKKLLIIKPYGVLGLELHEKKQEIVKIIEGVCLLLRKDETNIHSLTICLAKKGDVVTFEPKEAHGIIALTKTVIEETSLNAIDDLRYIFKASQIM